MTGFAPNSAAAPATVGGKLAVIDHWGSPWEGRGKRRIREPGDLPSPVRTLMPGGVPWQLGGLPARQRDAAARDLHPEDLSSLSGGVQVSLESRPQLFICLSCRRSGAAAAPEGEPTDGKRLYDAVSSLAAAMGAASPVQVVPTLCFANCERGCTAGISAPGKWSYVMGELEPDQAADLLLYGEAYAKAKTGVVLPSGRPASLQQSIIARFPSHLEPTKDAAE